jgi:iron(II)-dependent oxidoreductase
VWEWTASDFEVTDGQNRMILGEMPMKVIRGGAYDTYFETQATASFRTGQILLGRAHNVGFRCALDV